MTISEKKASVLLDCFHIAEFAPTPAYGDQVYCRKCGNYSTVQVVTVEWSVRCWNCRYSRRLGDNKEAAYAAARRHLDQRGHKTSIKVGKELVEVVEPPEGTLPLPGVAVDWRNSHQKVLRSHVASLSNRDV